MTTETETRTTDDRILDRLSDIAGERFQEDDITFEGTRLVIPQSMTAKDAVLTLRAHIEQQEEETRFSRTFKFRPWDGAAALNRALRTLTGTTGIGRAQYSFFGKTPPEMMTINCGLNDTMQVPWGAVDVPLFRGTLHLNSVSDPELGKLFHLIVDAPRKYKAPIEGLFRLVQEELETASIYRGKAFDGQEMPEFLDLDGIDASKVVYSDDVTAQFEANVWAMLRHTDAMRKNGVPLKRSVLLHGPYGTGKTLAAYLTAQVAVPHGWTFIYCRPGRDDLQDVMATARLYQPAVVFFEDVDSIGSSDAERDAVSKLLDLFDGIQAKGTELLAVLTTNHPERIHKGMVRPGRLDSVIEIGALDDHGVQRMVDACVPEDALAEDLKYDEIAESMEGFLPAFVKEAIDRAMRYAIARSGDVSMLTTEDFVLAAHGLRPQLEMMESAGEGSAPEALSVALTRTLREAIDDVPMYSSDDYLVGTIRPNGR